MRQYDLSPLYRSTVGFDRLFSLLDQMSGVDATAQSYPPYNIERTGENAYRISVAVAGFAEKDLAIETRENTLLIRGSKSAPEGDARASVPAGRPCPGHRRRARARTAPRRARPRDPGSRQAAPDSDRRAWTQGRRSQGRVQAGCLTAADLD